MLTKKKKSTFEMSLKEEAYMEISDYLSNVRPTNCSEEEMTIFLDYLMQIIQKESQILLKDYYYSIPNASYQNNTNQQPLINLYIIPYSAQPFNSNYQPIPNQIPINSQFLPPPPQQQIYTNPNFMNNYPLLPIAPPTQEITSQNKKKHQKNKKDIKKKKEKKKSKSSKKEKSSHQKKSDSKVKEFTYTEGKKFNGIMKYLIDKTGGNISENGTIEIKSNSIQEPFKTKFLVDYQTDEHYCTKHDVNDAYVIFDFKQRSIKLTSYSIQSFLENNCLKNWALEVSNDERTWVVIDRHTDDASIRGKYITATFNVETSGFYRYVRLRQTGKNWIGDNSTNINKIEFYGKLKEE